tara:strand:+ start:737 stop:1012 length:276 start_codon:yes stop_codon:yes gene_type:complete
MLIKKGSAGALVRAVQARVGAMVTGVWNTATYRKVYEYQKANKLNETGEVDEATHDHMFPPKVTQKPKAKVAKVEKKQYIDKHKKIKNETN